MVSIEKDNAFQLREYLHRKILDGADGDPFKSCFLTCLGLTLQPASFDFLSLPLYQKCAITGLSVLDEYVTNQDLSRLLGQAATIDSTPRPWVSDVFGIMALKWGIEKWKDEDLRNQFKSWWERFLPQQVSSNRFNIYEKDIATYIADTKEPVFSSACIPLFLHYHKILHIADHLKRQVLIGKFMLEFRDQAVADTPTALLGLMVYVFDKVNSDIVLVPPSGWALDELIRFLEHIPIGLKRWTWEDSGRTRNADPVKWPIENEYHVQNFLYVLLAPIFEDVTDEVYLKPIGQKTPRVDLYIPSMHTIIEVKYRKDAKKSFSMLIGEIAEDASLYHSDPTYIDARIICFLWDHTRSTQEHAKFSEGVRKLPGIDGCVVTCSPSTMI